MVASFQSMVSGHSGLYQDCGWYWRSGM